MSPVLPTARLAHVPKKIPRYWNQHWSNFFSLFAFFCDGVILRIERVLTKCRPYLPRHDKTTSNSRGSILSREDRNSHFFQAHTNTEKHTSGGDVSSCVKNDGSSSFTYRQAASCPQVWETAMPKGARREKIEPMKMVPRRPIQSFRGSETHPALGRC